MRRRDRERERTARSDNGGGESGGGPPGVDGGDSKAEGVDDRQSALKRIGMMPRQCGQTIVMRAAFAGSATADILGVATYDGQGQAAAAGPKQPTSHDSNHTSAKCRMHHIQMHTACLNKKHICTKVHGSPIELDNGGTPLTSEMKRALEGHPYERYPDAFAKGVLRGRAAYH
jgi:hypothetical protein